MLVSHDGDFYPAPPTAPRPADALLTTFRYTLLENGLDESEVRQLIEENPVRAFAVRVRT